MSRLCLPSVALCAVTSVAMPETIWAMERCLEQVAFGSACLLTDRAPYPQLPPSIECRRIEPIESRADYCEFILRRLVRHVDRPHVLIVQWDGFVIDASRWQPEFLEFDYVGAPWPQFDDGHTVGNGGFSLRSQRLLELTASPLFPGGHPEDVSICRTNRGQLEQQGMRFAPEAVAAGFSFERGSQTATFGFHGLFNFPCVLSRKELLARLEELDPRLLSGRDGTDLILELVRRGDRSLASRLARRRQGRKPWTMRDLWLWLRLAVATLVKLQAR